MAERARVHVRGTVQGVGFRPHVYRIARENDLGGWVINNTEGVVLEVEGQPAAIAAFVRDLQAKAPPLAVIESVEVAAVPPIGERDFRIGPSEAREGEFVPISPDVATCPDCQRELFDPSDRRHGYPFINCTNCGPRFTIVQDVPYDRPRTTMRVFPMCPDCEREYHDPTDRRFHAQPDACARCGPSLTLVDRAGQPLPLAPSPDGLDPSTPVVQRAAEALAAGLVLAIRGVGGFHLACDATNAEAVRTLRERKRRVDKPFAVMAADLAAARAFCEVSDAEAGLLDSAPRPIVLLRRRGSPEARRIAEAVAPRNRNLGVMLPYAPLQYLLLDAVAKILPAPVALVMTSGNLSEEPIATGNQEALDRLADLADLFLLHNREIHVRCDDSVARVFRGRPTLLRRSRGYVPAPVKLKRKLGEVLACGAELKNTFCLTRDDYAFLGQHIGDLENLETYESYRAAIEHMERIFRISPTVVAHDLHPDYLSTRYARERVAASGGRLRAVGVQHHQAHVASCLVENAVEGPTIGVAFDGTGYGTDGGIWGGEFFVGEYARLERVGHLAYVGLPGGDAAVRRPARMALSYLRAAFGADLPGYLPLLGRVSSAERRVVLRQLETGLNSPPTSSVGRLFDAVSAILDVRDDVNYEGQAAIELEMLADESEASGYAWQPVERDGALVLQPADLIRQVVADARSGVPREKIAARFHNAVAGGVIAVCEGLRARHGLDRVALSGGVYQNAYLLGRTLDGLEALGFTVYTHRLVPPNDGGIALGQAAIAAEAS